MKYSVAVKFIAIILCAASIVAIVASGCGILFMEAYNLYNESLDTQRENQLENMASRNAWYWAERYAAETLGNCPVEIRDDILSHYGMQGKHAVTIAVDGELIPYVNDASSIENAYVQTYTITPNYPVVAYQYTVNEDGSYSTEAPSLEDSRTNEPAAMSEDALPDETLVYTDEHIETYWDESGARHMVGYVVNYYQGPEYEVTVYLDAKSALGTEFALMSLLYGYRELFIPVLLISLLIFAVTVVYLCVAAGKTKTGEVCPAGLNRLPLDLYTVAAVSLEVAIGFLVVFLLDSFYGGYHSIWDNLPLCALILGLGGFLMALTAVGLLYAFVAQFKVKNGYWWRHSVCGWCLRQVAGVLLWVRRGLRYFYRGCRAVVRMLPIIWQWLLTAFLMVLSVAVTFLLAFCTWGFTQVFFFLLFFLCVVGCIALVCYGGWCFGALLKGVKAMSQGDLNHQVPTKYLFGTFKEFAEQLNCLAGAAQRAAQQQMKSERMKTELITNVSHDIKTPLTSIINYVDLLKKPHTDGEAEQYLEVLDRQSQRLKKLIDDLMEMSKASSGNIAVELGQVDAVEAVNQALGEFADKLDRVGLTPVFRHPEFPVTMRCDGKLVWRVLSNILNNAVKYALPDTRLYIDLMVLQGNAVIAVKNISRDQLNVNADELMERFVRGDSSRNTEGSGLGLNIAKSLVEIQNGQMHLMVDGDLFKVTLIFPCS